MKAANQDLQKVFNAWDWDELNAFGTTKGMQWKFIPANAPYQNDISGVLMKSVKNVMSIATGESTLAFSKLRTVCYEAANLVNKTYCASNVAQCMTQLVSRGCGTY